MGRCSGGVDRWLKPYFAWGSAARPAGLHGAVRRVVGPSSPGGSGAARPAGVGEVVGTSSLGGSGAARGKGRGRGPEGEGCFNRPTIKPTSTGGASLEP
jgi:hypothetical protein